jgi:hypothetical protein
MIFILIIYCYSLLNINSLSFPVSHHHIAKKIIIQAQHLIIKTHLVVRLKFITKYLLIHYYKYFSIN